MSSQPRLEEQNVEAPGSTRASASASTSLGALERPDGYGAVLNMPAEATVSTSANGGMTPEQAKTCAQHALAMLKSPRLKFVISGMGLLLVAAAAIYDGVFNSWKLSNDAAEEMKKFINSDPRLAVGVSLAGVLSLGVHTARALPLSDQVFQMASVVMSAVLAITALVFIPTKAMNDVATDQLTAGLNSSPAQQVMVGTAGVAAATVVANLVNGVQAIFARNNAASASAAASSGLAEPLNPEQARRDAADVEQEARRSPTLTGGPSAL